MMLLLSLDSGEYWGLMLYWSQCGLMLYWWYLRWLMLYWWYLRSKALFTFLTNLMPSSHLRALEVANLRCGVEQPRFPSRMVSFWGIMGKVSNITTFYGVMSCVRNGVYKQMSYSYLLKYIIIGDQSVGKSCLLMRFVDDEFKIDCDATIGVEFGSKTIRSRDKVVKLQIWDTAGQQAYKSITRSYYRGTIGVVLVYDVTSLSSFDAVGRWLEEAKNLATNENMEVVLVGNKTDLAGSRRVSFERGAEYARVNHLHFIESSAKTGYNACYSFELLTQKIIGKIEAGLIDTSDENGGVKLGEYSPLGAKVQLGRRCC